MPRLRRQLWIVAAFALFAMAAAAWQIRPVEAPVRAVDALESSLGSTLPSNGEPAAMFVVPLRGGGEFSLDRHFDTGGGPVLLNLWASWCIPCRKEMPLLDDVAPLYPSVVFLGVAVNDSRSSAEAFADELGVEYPIGFDTSGTLADAYPAPAMPVTYIIDANRIVKSRFFGELTADTIDELLRDVA